MEVAGPLQLAVLNLIWRAPQGTEFTVAEVYDAINLNRRRSLNVDPNIHPLAYTTYLTVLRNLARRGFLEQKAVPGDRSHKFLPKITRAEYEKNLLETTLRDFYEGDAREFLAAVEAMQIDR